jgi:hypothetical protein
MRKSTLAAGLLALSLAACMPKTTLVYEVETDTVDATKNAALFDALERVTLRRFSASQIEGATATVVPAVEGPSLFMLTLPSSATAEEAERILQEPFSFDLLIEKPAPSGNPEESEWLETGIDNTNVLWLQPLVSPAGDVAVEVQLDDIGKALLEDAFKGHTGKNVGIFVRDLLVSKMSISSETVNSHIVISGIPNAKIAEVFSDDVNVGLHVLLHPVDE